MSLIQRENKVALAKGTTWGTAVEPGAGHGYFVKAHTPPKGARKIVTNEDEFGRGMASEGQILEYEAQSGSMSLRVYWEGLEPMLASLMGKYDHTGAGPYTHTFTLATVGGGIFHTVAWEEGTEVKCVDSATIVSGTFAYADGLNLDVNYLGDKVSITSGWTDPWGAAVTSPSEGKGIFKLSNATVWVNGVGDADFAVGDKLFPSGIDVAVTRGFEGLAVTAGNDAISEPIEKTAPTVEATLTFPKKETATAAFFNAFKGRDYKKMQIRYEAVDGSDTYSIVFNFPKMFIMEAPDFAADSPIPTTIKLKALLASTPPTGMTAGVPYIQLTNKIATPLSGYPSAS
jgi:hypothetical protein